jgi:hypothetical protein
MDGHSLHSYLLGDEQYVRQWQQFRDVASPHNNKYINKSNWILEEVITGNAD